VDILSHYQKMDYGPAPESRAAADLWLQETNMTSALLIDGQWCSPATPATFDVREPASDALLATIGAAGHDEVEAAVLAARKALPQWQAKSGYQRARILYAIGRMMQRHSRLFAVLESLDNGKPIRESRDIDVPLAIRHFLHHAGWAQSLENQFPAHIGVGVVGQIIPWNFPLLMLAWKIAPALACGCTIVLKPADLTPLTAILFAQICQNAGVPKGVVNIVHGGAEVGAMIVNHPQIDKIAFTGSVEVGKQIRQATAGTAKKLSLELGGKSAFILFDDADLDSAVEGLVDGIWFNQGQVCCAGSRLLVQENIAGRILPKIKARMEKLRLGSPLDKNTDIGPLISKTQLERVCGLIKQGAEQGACIWQPQTVLPSQGWYHAPVLASDVSPANILAEREVFGPVLAAMTFRTTQEAVELANNSRYGLAASIWSENINLALHVAPQIKAGVIWVNGSNMFDASCGFGGYRESGFGREGGREGLGEYLKLRAEKKTVPLKISSPAPSPLPSSLAGGGGDSSRLIDRTVKLFIGGKQVRPDGAYTMPVFDSKGKWQGEAPLGNRKDIRQAVACARAAKGWASATAYNRAQVLYYFAENLESRTEEFAARLSQLTGAKSGLAHQEVNRAIEVLFWAAGMADKFEGVVHTPPMRAVTLALHEPVGVLGIVAPDHAPLLGVISMLAPALAMGNRVVLVPSSRWPLVASDLYQVIETSDIPAGVVNIVTGATAELTEILAKHDDVDGLWVVADDETCENAQFHSSGNLKRVWTSRGNLIAWENDEEMEFLNRAVEVKNIWVPYGD